MKIHLRYVLASMLLLLGSCQSKNDKESSEKKITVEKPVGQEGPQFIHRLNTPQNRKFSDTVIRVSSFADLYRHLGSNRTLELAMPRLELPEQWKDKSNLNLDMSFGLKVSGLSNLKIVGVGARPTEIVQSASIFKVMEFYKCDNIVLENLIAGHAPKKGGCAASVFAFTDCRDIFINKCDMYGSGYEGITAFKTKNLSCSESVIRECSFQILSVSQSFDIRFFNCAFKNNTEPYGAGKMYLAASDQIIFNGCTFADNAAYLAEPADDPFIKVEDCQQVYMKDCFITNNKARFFTLRDSDVMLINVKSDGNSWQQRPA